MLNTTGQISISSDLPICYSPQKSKERANNNRIYIFFLIWKCQKLPKTQEGYRLRCYPSHYSLYLVSILCPDFTSFPLEKDMTNEIIFSRSETLTAVGTFVQSLFSKPSTHNPEHADEGQRWDASKSICRTLSSPY